MKRIICTIAVVLLTATTCYAGGHNASYYYRGSHGGHHGGHHGYNSNYYNTMALTSVINNALVMGTAIAMQPKAPIVMAPQTPYPATLTAPRGCTEHWTYSQEYNNYVKVCTPYQ